jgi:hypothetical protein
MSVLRILKFLRIPPSTGPASSAIFDTLKDRSFAVFVLIYLIVLMSFMFTFQLVQTHLYLDLLFDRFLDMICLISDQLEFQCKNFRWKSLK